MRMLTKALLSSALALSACGGDDSDSPLAQREVVDQAKAGTISLATYSDGTKGYRYTVRPTFLNATSSGKCTVAESGPCRKISCASDRSSLHPENAGTIHFKAGSNSSDVSFDFNGYPSVQEERSYFQGGETISFSADGSFVPKFSGNVKAPGPVFVTAPLDASLSIAKAQDFTFSWSGTSEGVVVFQLQPVSGKIDQNDVKFECRFLGSETSGVIPKSAFDLLPAGDYVANVFTRSRSVVTTGEWSVALEGVYFAGVKDVGAYNRNAQLK